MGYVHSHVDGIDDIQCREYEIGGDLKGECILPEPGTDYLLDDGPRLLSIIIGLRQRGYTVEPTT